MQPLMLDGRAGAGVLFVADHASNHVPPGLDLGVAPDLMLQHMAWDIGVADLTVRLAEAASAPAVLCSVSRLVLDCNRAPDSIDLIPVASDGHLVPGNAGLPPAERQRRIEAIHAPYHATIAAAIDRHRPSLLVAIHSFTPSLTSRPAVRRPWEIGLLYNRDNRAASIALEALAPLGLCVGDNQPYSGRDLNYTMDLHGEARGIAYLSVEIRQDLLASDEQVGLWAERLAPVIAKVQERLARRA